MKKSSQAPAPAISTRLPAKAPGGTGAGSGAGAPGKDKRPTSSGMPSRGGAGADGRGNAKGKGTKGKARDADELDGALEARRSDGQKDGEVSLAWLYLPAELIDELDSCEPEDELAKIAQALGITGWKEDLQSSILVSFYHSNYTFAKENKFSQIQISVVFSILKATLDKALEKSLVQVMAIAEFKKMLFDYTSTAPSALANQSSASAVESAGWEIFSPGESKLIIDYAMSTLFQHYRLFQYVFSNEQEKQEIECPVQIELPPTAPPLADAITLEAYETEQRAREQAERELMDAQGLANAADALEALPPEELKLITLDTISSLLESVSAEFDRMLLDQRQRFLAQFSKIPAAKE
ncbi:hypothetical protein HK105_202157 [Polyrhizophydium stewartii]|uniref:Uncharacterized protein n=1 Tax=Polyrhizophydium stewartii TaxID=2732419 RepID=A0ABR4NFD5_9FUNG